MNWTSKKLAERSKQLAQIVQIFKKVSKEAAYKIRKLQQMGADKVASLKKEMAEEKVAVLTLCV